MRPRRVPFRAALVLFALAAAVPARAQFRAGSEFRVNSYTTNIQIAPAVAIEPEGEFAIVWQSDLQDGGIIGVFGRSFRDDGSPRGPEFLVNVFTTGAQYRAGVAHDGNEFVVVWSSDGQDGSGLGVFGRRFDKDGTPNAGEFRVNEFTTNVQRATAVAKDRRSSRGGFVVVWTDNRDGYGNVMARRYDERGVPTTGEITVNTYTTALQTDGQIAMMDDGRFVVVWTSYRQDGDLGGVFARAFDAAANPVTAEIQVNSYTSGSQCCPAVDIAGDGRFVVTWEQFDGSARGVFGQRFAPAGTRVGPEFQVNTFTTGYQVNGSVGVNKRGDAVAVWENLAQDGSGWGVFGQRFDKDGVRIGTEFQINTYTTGHQLFSDVDTDEVGNFVVTWSSDGQDGSSQGVYAQRFGGILFTAIGVDGTPTLGPYRGPLASDGNGVLEPGETVVVETSWKNVSGVAQTLNGTVLSFTGPAGPTYVVPDPNASFGTIPSGATQSCAVTGDCYVVGVSGPRPVTHWDGVMEEGNNNIILGQAKLWNIHVGDSFADVPRANPFYRFVETLLHRGVTGGCTAAEYCPAASTTRDQMAVFVTTAASGPLFAPPACGPVPMFADVPAPFCRWIEDLARRGVVGGCGGGNYCPRAPVTREQMGVFLARTFGLLLYGI